MPAEIIIVAIDEPSLQAIGAWPWPRDRHAEALDRIAAARPRAIVYDLLFTEPRPEDPALAAALGRAGKVALPLQFAVPGSYRPRL